MAVLQGVPDPVALIRGSTSDPDGNITMEREALTLDNLALAMAAKNSNGFVIAQVERIAAPGALHPRQVIVPGVMVDCVVIAQPANHCQTYGTPYSPAFSGEFRVPLDSLKPLPHDERRIIARRCAFELPMGGVVNLGIGMPEGIAAVANEERVLDYVTLTAEPGVIGGVPQSGLDFGAAVNTDAVIQQSQQFDFYDGGGLDWRVSAWPRLMPTGTSMSVDLGRGSPAPAASSTSARTRDESFSRGRSPPAARRRYRRRLTSYRA